MNRNLIALILAFSLFLTGFSAIPARAGSDNIAKVAFGAFALVIVGNILHNTNKNNNRKNEVSKGQYPTNVFFPPQNKHPKKRPPQHSKAKPTLPSSCFFNVHTPYGPRGVYGRKCLNEKMRYVTRLPISCHDNVPIRNGRRAEVFAARCLSKHGYRVAGYRS
jgi:hypothetical protein